MLPCTITNVLQRWECKNDTLFGIQGEDFYLNYDKGNGKVVILKALEGRSQWKIYGTPDDLCAKTYEGKVFYLRSTPGQLYNQCKSE